MRNSKAKLIRELLRKDGRSIRGEPYTKDLWGTVTCSKGRKFYKELKRVL